MKRVLLAVLLLIVHPLLFAQAKPDVARKFEALMKAEKYADAVALLNPLIKASPQNAVLFDMRGQALTGLEKAQDAYNDFTEAISLDGKKYDYYLHRAVLFYLTQNPEDAISDNLKALSMAASDSVRNLIRINLGSARMMKRDFEGAYADYLAVLQSDSLDKAALTNIGAVLDELGRGDEAIPFFEKTIRHYPDFVGGYANLAFRYSNMGKYDKALELSNTAIRKFPNEAVTYNNRGYILYKMNRLTDAMADINKSIEMYKENSYAYKNRALVYLALKQNEKACKDLETALQYGFALMYGEEVTELRTKWCQ
jgi:tetratricopeptide (TPR) repeat protein